MNSLRRTTWRDVLSATSSATRWESVLAIVFALLLTQASACSSTATPVPAEAGNLPGTQTYAEAESKSDGQAGTATATGQKHDQDEIQHWTCSMHPSVQKSEPGTCPICSMGLVPVLRSEAETGVIRVDVQRRQLIGVRTSTVRRQPLVVTIRAEGRVTYDQTHLTDVSLKYRGWIGHVYVDKPGQRVERGEPLFDLYSPDLYAAQEEFLAALASQNRAQDSATPKRADYLVKAARQRLRLWDLQPAQIDALARRATPLEYIPILSPASDHVISKAVVQGSPVDAGTPLYRIAELDSIWIEAELYEFELSLVRVGQNVHIDLPYLPGQTISGRVAFIYPYLDKTARTGRIRVVVDNPDLQLKPEMYANVVLEVSRGERLAIPEEAVMYAGPRRVVFLDLGEGRLKPQEVTLGVKADGVYEVLDGLQEGDVVVTSGNFLIAAESRLKSAMGKW